MTIPLAFMQMYNDRAPYEEEIPSSCKEGLKDFYIGRQIWTIDSIGRCLSLQNQNLASFKYSNKGTTIGAIRTNAFTDAFSLPATDINNLIKNSTEFWNAAFYSCHQLDKLTIPASLKFIDNAGAFGDCPITDVYLTKNYFSCCSSL